MARRHGGQPAPIATGGAAIADLVISDLRERDRIGRKRYGTRLQAHNGRDALWDAYEEVLDLAQYLRQRIEEERHPRPRARKKRA